MIDAGFDATVKRIGRYRSANKYIQKITIVMRVGYKFQLPRLRVA